MTDVLRRLKKLRRNFCKLSFILISTNFSNLNMEYQKQPLKLYIQDIYRAKRSEENKYVYLIFGKRFKNIMIHGVVTSMYNTRDKTTNFEISDPTGCIHVYFDSTKSNEKIDQGSMKDIIKHFAVVSQSGDDNAPTMAKLVNLIEKKHKNPIGFEEGDNVSVIGDIFVDDLRNVRMISAFQCRKTSAERDLVWLEELKYLYDKYYLST